jgi:hypothetical protein
MMATTVEKALPTEAEYDAASEAVWDAFKRVESIGHLLHVAIEKPESADVDLADVGALWSFIDGVRIAQWTLKEEVDRLTELLGRLDGVRLDGLPR